MPRRNGAIPLIATTVDGRPIKLEGNPLHPASRGATDTFTQASILDLYDPTRSKRFVRDGKTSKREDFEAYVRELRNKLVADHGDGLAFLVEETNSPTRERLRGELEKNLPGMRWCVYEPFLSQGTSAAAQTAFGAGARADSQIRSRRCDPCVGQRFSRLRPGRSRVSPRIYLSSAREYAQRQHEPALCRGKSVHAHGRDGGPSAPLSG